MTLVLSSLAKLWYLCLRDAQRTSLRKVTCLGALFQARCQQHHRLRSGQKQALHWSRTAKPNEVFDAFKMGLSSVWNIIVKCATGFQLSVNTSISYVRYWLFGIAVQLLQVVEQLTQCFGDNLKHLMRHIENCEEAHLALEHLEGGTLLTSWTLNRGSVVFWC